MRKMILCALLLIGVVNFGFGQLVTKSERISVKTYDSDGIAEQFQLKGEAALAFDIPAFINDNDYMERVLINGTFKNDLSTTIIRFDSNDEANQYGEYICKETSTDQNPFLGVWGTGSVDLDGVDIKKVIPTTSAAIAGIISNEVITEYDGVDINTFCDLQKAVNASTIGDKVELRLEKGTKQYSKYVVVGSRDIHKVTYKYCVDEPINIIDSEALDSDVISLSAYPNPTPALTYINFKSTSDEDVIFTVTDMTGALIHKEIFSNFTGQLGLDYNLEAQTDGTYIISMQQGTELYNRKVQLVK